MSSITTSTFTLSYNESDIAYALHGTGVISWTVPEYKPFQDTLQQFYNNPMVTKLFAHDHSYNDQTNSEAILYRQLWSNYTFSQSQSNNNSTTSITAVRPTLTQYLTYDAVIAMALAACEAPHDALLREGNVNGSGTLLIQQLLQTKFVGVSGNVSFDSKGTRITNDTTYQIQNIRLVDTDTSNNDNDTYYRFTAPQTALIHGNGHVTYIPDELFVYSNNSTVPLPVLPPIIHYNYNLIPSGVRIFGLILAGILQLITVGWIVWTLHNRNKDVVRASQPIFLCLICIGTLTMSSSIYTVSMQERPDELSRTTILVVDNDDNNEYDNSDSNGSSFNRLDAACMATPYLLSLGFVIIFSALFSKTWRLNIILQSAMAMKRVKVRVQDVLLPFGILLTLNIAVLVSWTIIAPLQWVRYTVDNYDNYRRSVESIGSCRAIGNTSDDNRIVISFMITLFAINVSALLFAMYQAYLSRKLPTEFSESTYIAASMLGMLEAFALAGPILIMTRNTPTSFFISWSILVTITCLVVQLPIFVPKYIKRRHNAMIERRKRLGLTDPIPDLNSKRFLPNVSSIENSTCEIVSSSVIARTHSSYQSVVGGGTTHISGLNN
jgi:7 transmembrane sweet-taste receptor of 3 GCPR/Receptor family ligand binding region